jgi:UDP-3-O-[3-hydroxymyristoyl] N-acetylglucosamine deacetylase
MGPSNGMMVADLGGSKRNCVRQQQTIARSITCSGIGLHTLHPAPPDTGIVFVLAGGQDPILFGASIRNVVETELCTALRSNGAMVQTVEHVLSALAGLEIDNAYVELDAAEVPVMDGSAGPFVRLIRTAGIRTQDKRQPFLKITQPIEVQEGDRRVVIEPAATSRITYTIEYPHPLIRRQSYSHDWSVDAFEQKIADARTFGFLHEVRQLWARGLGKGGSLENTVVLSEEGILNESGLRFPDEFVRHKILDLVGDLSLLGVPMVGHLIADRSGHALHTKLVQRILEQPDKWVLINAEGALDPKPRTVRPAAPAVQAIPVPVQAQA